MKITGAEIFVQVLIEQGVDTLFGYPGGAVLDIYDALYKNSDKINHYLTAHEQGASHAADGYARATGKTGVVLATSGPGATNLVTGIATAYMDSVPMVAITGNVGTSLIGKDSFQEVFIAGITMPITKHNFVVRDVNELADILRDAFRIAQTGRKGPVLVDIPKDITNTLAEFTPLAPVTLPQNPKVEQSDLITAAKMINEAQCPIIYFGGGVTASEAGEELRSFMAKSEMPATYTLMAAGVLGYGEKLNLGLLGMHGSRTTNSAVDKADLVLAIGTRFSDRVAMNTKQFAKNAKILHIDIDASEVNKNVAVDFSIIGDVKEVLAALIPLIEQKSRPEWLAKIKELQDKDYKPKDDDSILKPHQVIAGACDIAGENSLYVTDVGQHQMWCAQYIKHTMPRSFLTSGGLGTMGFGYGAAIGAKIAIDENRRVIHFTGDGSFHMNLHEACTAVSYEVPVITVIFNNSVLGMVRQWQTVFYEKRFSATDPKRKTDFVKLADGFGLKCFRCTNLAEFKEAMAKAVALNEPVWIECIVDRDEKVLPMIPSGGTIDDMMMS